MSPYALLSYDYGKAIFSILASFSRESFKYEIFKDFRAKTLNPVLWYVNRKSITRAVFVGTFFGLLPIPFHSVFIVMAVLLFEVNLPISLMLAWLSNPLTLAPILYIGFWFGAHIYHVHMINKKMLLGCFTRFHVGLRILVMVISI